MKTQGQKIRENIEDAQHPDEIGGDEFNREAYIAYTARLLMEAGDESASVSAALICLQDNPSHQIGMSMKVTKAVKKNCPEIARNITDLGLGAGIYIRSCRYAARAIHGVVEHDHK